MGGRFFHPSDFSRPLRAKVHSVSRARATGHCTGEEVSENGVCPVPPGACYTLRHSYYTFA